MGKVNQLCFGFWMPSNIEMKSFDIQFRIRVIEV